MNAASRSRTVAHLPATLALCMACLLAGCKANAPQSASNQTATSPTAPNQPAAGQQQVLRSDGTYGPAPASAPAATGAPSAAAPAAPYAASAPPPPPSAPAGTAVVFRTGQSLSTAQSELGQHFSGTLERPIVSHGVTVFAAGTPVTGSVVALQGKGTFKGAGDLGVTLVDIGGHSVQTSEYEKVDKGKGKRTAAFIGGGAGLGALIGGLAGHGRGAVIGGLAGAGAGTAGAATGSRTVVLPAETVLTVRLRTELTR